MFTRFSLSLAIILALGKLLSPSLHAAEPTSIPGIGPAGDVVKLHTGFKFTEGPAADRAGNLYFSDVPNERIYKIDANGALSVFREKTNRANGLMVSAKGELIACEMAGRVVAFSPDGKDVRVLADGYEGKRFNAPNDLMLDKSGGVYVSDPSFDAPEPLPQGKTAVYYIDAYGKVTRLIDDLTQPNGLALSPDEETLYVIQTGPADMMAYPVESPGRLGKGRVFCKLQDKDGKREGDSCGIDSKGNLYVATALGVQVFDSSGKGLGVIPIPEQPSNVTFGGKDMKTLYVTARTSLYAIPMEQAGPLCPAESK
jgi:gluconolactonase